MTARLALVVALVSLALTGICLLHGCVCDRQARDCAACIAGGPLAAAPECVRCVSPDCAVTEVDAGVLSGGILVRSWAPRDAGHDIGSCLPGTEGWADGTPCDIGPVLGWAWHCCTERCEPGSSGHYRCCGGTIPCQESP